MQKKIDIHVHAARKRIDVPFGNPMDSASHYICDPEEMVQTLTAQGLGNAILMSSGEAPCNGVHTLECYNQDCMEIAKNSHGFFWWMCSIDPVDLNTVEDRLRKYQQQGAVGIGEVMVNQWLDSPYMQALFCAAEKLKMPVLCHMSPDVGFSYGVSDRPGLPLLEQTLKEHPGLPYIGHSQVFWLEISADCPKSGNAQRNGFGKGPVVREGTVERLLTNYPNLYADLSAFSGSCAVMRDEVFGAYFLERYQNQLLFGTDTTNKKPVSHLRVFWIPCCGRENSAGKHTIKSAGTMPSACLGFKEEIKWMHRKWNFGKNLSRIIPA